MKKKTSARLAISLLLIALVGCRPSLSAGQVPRVTPTPCATATPLGARSETTANAGSARPAQHTTPQAPRPLSPHEVATREAALKNTNRPATVPAATPEATALPVCPTATPSP